MHFCVRCNKRAPDPRVPFCGYQCAVEDAFEQAREHDPVACGCDAAVKAWVPAPQWPGTRLEAPFPHDLALIARQYDFYSPTPRTCDINGDVLDIVALNDGDRTLSLHAARDMGLDREARGQMRTLLTELEAA